MIKKIKDAIEEAIFNPLLSFAIAFAAFMMVILFIFMFMT
tara:strand:- start:334 stop:453 length:120 start_codon:yes stop_codon:yes gene_type:complete